MRFDFGKFEPQVGNGVKDGGGDVGFVVPKAMLVQSKYTKAEPGDRDDDEPDAPVTGGYGGRNPFPRQGGDHKNPSIARHGLALITITRAWPLSAYPSSSWF